MDKLSYWSAVFTIRLDKRSLFFVAKISERKFESVDMKESVNSLLSQNIQKFHVMLKPHSDTGLDQIYVVSPFSGKFIHYKHDK